MRKLCSTVILSFLCFCVVAFAASPRQSRPMEKCGEYVPYGIPASPKSDLTRICREGYALEHDNKAKIPVWVSYTLTPEKVLSCASRTNDFDPELSIQPPLRAAVSDYAKSGYDIGHMASNADMRWSPQVEIESNVLSNAAPQLPGLNRGPWKQLEELTRVWAVERKTSLLIYVGPIYNSKSSSRIGNGRVVVPDAFFKVIIDQKNGDVISFIYPADANSGDPINFLTSFHEVQRLASLQLGIPKPPVFATRMWHNDVKTISSHKSAVCMLK